MGKMKKISEEQMLDLSETEFNKFTNKVENDWAYYMFQYKVWQNKVREIKKSKNGFGMELPNIQVEINVLFENFIDIEIKKTKNKKYCQFLTSLL